MKIDSSLAIEALKISGATPEGIRRAIEFLNNRVEDAKPDPAPRLKSQHVILVSDPTGLLKGHDLAGWVLQVEEGVNPSVVLARLKTAASTYNESKKGRLYPVKTVGEALEGVPRKFWEGAAGTRCGVRTKTPVLVVTTTNEL